jgi:hypothetical protein
MTINILPLLVFIAAALIGMVAHWYKKYKRGEVQGNLISYLLADYPGRSFSTLLTIITIAFGAATTGAIDGLDLSVFWNMLLHGKAHIPTISVVSSAFMLGWTLDSGINKGN